MTTRLLLLLLISLSITLTACQSATTNSLPSDASKSAISSKPKELKNSSNVHKSDKDTQHDFAWQDAFNSITDMNGDDVSETINIYISGKSVETFNIKAKINNTEKIFKFEPEKFGIVSLIKCQFIRISNNKKGLLMMFSSEKDYPGTENKNPPPWWIDRNFIIIGFDSNNVTTFLDGFNAQYNNNNNYKRYYEGNYIVKFQDLHTKLTANIKLVDKPEESDLSEDDIKSVIDSIGENNACVSMNYIDIHTTNLNSKSTDNIVCSKFIPGLVNRTMLGTIDYIYEFQNDKYVLVKEVLNYLDKGLYKKIIEINI